MENHTAYTFRRLEELYSNCAKKRIGAEEPHMMDVFVEIQKIVKQHNTLGFLNCEKEDIFPKLAHITVENVNGELSERRQICYYILQAILFGYTIIYANETSVFFLLWRKIKLHIKIFVGANSTYDRLKLLLYNSRDTKEDRIPGDLWQQLLDIRNEDENALYWCNAPENLPFYTHFLISVDLQDNFEKSNDSHMECKILEALVVGRTRIAIKDQHQMEMRLNEFLKKYIYSVHFIYL